METHWIKNRVFCWIKMIAGIFVFGYVVMLLWNWLIPSVFSGASVINYWQALGMLVLSRFLFGGWRRGGCHGNRGYWRHRFKGHWETMSEEEREKFRRCCDPNCCETEEKK